MTNKNYGLATLGVRAGQTPDPVTGAQAVPIFQTTSYVFKDSDEAARRFALQEFGQIYSRLTNPTSDVFEARIAAIEGGNSGISTSSGLAAISYAILNVTEPGDNIVSADNLYGGSYNLITHTLAASKIAHSIVKINDLAALEAAIQPNTKVIYAETLGNPNSDVLNIEGVAEVAHKHGIVFIVDNTFAPLLIRPLEHGADIVVHSATKFIGGHGTTLGGVIVDGGKFDWKANADRYPSIAKPDASYHGAVFADVAGPAAFVTRIRAVILRDTGAAISPFNAWILLQGVESLPLRIERHTENALKVVDYLSKHPQVAKVNHPALASHPDHALYQQYFPRGGASIFTFEIKGGQEAAWKFIDALQIFTLLANVADVKSLVIHPATTTHSQLSDEELAEQHITPSTIRLSIGVEHIDDIIADLEQAFNAIK
jgi:O-acetylhomoserine (thiol)-lyase